MATVITFAVKVGGTIGTDCDYTSLNGADTYNIDLTSADTKVYGGSKTLSIANGAALTLYRGGSPQDLTGVCHRAAYGGAQILVRGISGTATPQSADQWRVDASNYFAITDGGDSAIVKITGATTSAADTAAVDIVWTTSATNYLEICAASGHEAGTQWSTSKYRLEVTDATAILTGNNVNGLRLTQLQLGVLSTGTGNTLFSPVPTGQYDFRISKCLMHGHAVDDKRIISDISTGLSGSKTYFWNNVLYDMTGGGTIGGNAVYFAGSNHTLYCYNNTFVDCAVGIRVGTLAAMYIFNNLIDCTDCLYGTFTNDDANCDYNACSDATTTGGTHDRSSCSFTYQDEDINDFALGATDDDARDLGVDPGSYASGALDFEDDILGTTRPYNSVWDIGAHEYETTTNTCTGEITLPSVTVSASYIQAPDELYCNNYPPGASEGDTNPTDISDTTPNFSANIYKLGSNITQVQIQVSAAGDSDFSEELSWDSGWLTLTWPITTNDTRMQEDIVYGQT